MRAPSSLLLVLLCCAPLAWADPEYVDLGRAFDNKTLYWIDSTVFKFTKKVARSNVDGTWYAANEFMAAEHGGTHLDAPHHFSKNGWKVGDIPLDRLIVPAVLMDMRSEVANQPDFDLLPQHISDWEEEHGEIPDDSVVLIRYGWGIYYNNRTRYFGFEKHGRNMHFPGLSRELATRGTLVGVGTDTPSVDAGKSVTYRPHVHLQTTNMYVLENLDLEHDNMPERDFTLWVMPMKIAEGTGAPCRVIAVLNFSPSVETSFSLILSALALIRTLQYLQ
ncbi:isatin hydrolase-like [Periplaneta americana]|uniref:isatin hydrolase-like n=1 Tax=Periplaneta americana TaxID=6978 RepID=UPI0037E77D83